MTSTITNNKIHHSPSRNRYYSVLSARQTRVDNIDGIFRSEFPSVPIQDVPVHVTIEDAIWRHIQEQPSGRAAFISAECPDERITFAEFMLQCRSVASFLDSAVGFGRGDVAGVVTQNCWQFLAAFMGAALQGGCISGANSQLTEEELARQFADANCRLVFCYDFMLDKMLAVMRINPKLKHVVLVPSQFPAKPLANLPPNIHNWAEIVQKRPNFEKPIAAGIDVSRDLAYLPFSSGTTGHCKGVMLSHGNVGTMLRIFNRHFDERIVQKMDPEWDWARESAIIMLPLYHIYGFILGLNSLMTGATSIMFKKFDLEIFCRTVQEYKIKYATLVPPILVYLAKSPAVTSRFDLSSLRFVMSGGAPAGDDICDELKRAIPSLAQIAQGYGMTEQSMASHLPVFGMDNQRAAGRLAANYEMKIVNVETREVVKGSGELGEICTRSPTTMMGYLNRPDATAETIEADGWLRTGDIGYRDEAGWTYVVDRLKELIKVKGLQVAPAELEDLLLAHPGIKDCAVIGVADPMCGEVPKAFVVKGDEKLAEEEVKEFVKGKVAVFKQLKFVEFIDAIPKSPSGKILRRMLREREKLKGKL